MEYYPQFPTAILHLGVRSIALLTRPPLALAGTFNLHALAMPPAFSLSHDQTLQLNAIVTSHDLHREMLNFFNEATMLFPNPNLCPSCDAHRPESGRSVNPHGLTGVGGKTDPL
jgi:hypothetical protein